jgi:hypothetical protein
MKNRSLILAGAVALAGVSLLSAKSYDIIIGSPTQAGKVELTPGEYKLQVKGSDAVFTNVDNNKKFTTPVKVQPQSKKFDVTAVDTTKVKGKNQVTAIELGGSPNELQFGE